MSTVLAPPVGIANFGHSKDSAIGATPVKLKGTQLLFVILTLLDHAREILKDADERTDIIHNLTFALIKKVKQVKEDFLNLKNNQQPLSEPVQVSGYTPAATQPTSGSTTNVALPSAARSAIPSDFSDLDVLDCALFVLCDTVRTLQEYIEKDRREKIQVNKSLGTFFQGE